MNIFQLKQTMEYSCSVTSIEISSRCTSMHSGSIYCMHDNSLYHSSVNQIHRVYLDNKKYYCMRAHPYIGCLIFGCEIKIKFLIAMSLL